MTITYCDIRVQLVDHTVSERGGFLAGYLARDMASRKELGHVWRAGKVWRFRAPDGSSGERTSQHSAAATLRTLVLGCTAQEDLDRRCGGWQTPERQPDARRAEDFRRPQAAPRQTPRPAAPAAAPAAPRQQIVWNDQTQSGSDLTAAIAARLGRK